MYGEQMERGQVIVVAILIAAIGLFGLQFFSGPPATIAPPGAVDVEPGGGGGAGIGTGYGTDAAGGVGPGRSGGKAGGVGRTGRLEPGASQGSAGRRSAEAILGAGRSGGGSVGVSGSSGRDGASARIGLADIGRSSALSSDRLQNRDQSRTELIETLASQPPSPGGLKGAEDIADPEQEIVLSVNSPEDTERAEEVREIEPPPSGEEGIVLTPDSKLVFPDAGNVRGDAGTISLDVVPNWAGSDESNNSLVQIVNPNQWSNAFLLVKNGRYLRFVFRDNTGAERDISVPIDAWTPGDRHNVTVTWGDAATAMYIDGRMVGQNTYPGQLEIRPGTPMHLGSAFENFRGFDGGIKAEVFGRAKNADEVAGR